MIDLEFADLRAQVMRNCHIADARHGGDFGMCTYLMKMRELFRWEQGLGFTARLPREAVGDWLLQREAEWTDLAEEDYGTIDIGGRAFDPFDTAGINGVLEPFGLVYSAGLIQGGRPNFFLAELEAREASSAAGGSSFELWLSGRELARGLHTPPAMNCGRSIFVRRDALRRYLFERYETWRWRSPDNAMAKALACYPFESDLDTALESMTDAELAAAREHEIGECLAGERLGDRWYELLAALALTPAEMMSRAVRDHLADCMRTLPALLDEGREASIHFFVGNLSAMRNQLFPSLKPAYEEWRASGSDSRLRQVASQGAEHWAAVADELITLNPAGEEVAGRVQALIESRAF